MASIFGPTNKSLFASNASVQSFHFIHVSTLLKSKRWRWCWQNHIDRMKYRNIRWRWASKLRGRERGPKKDRERERWRSEWRQTSQMNKNNALRFYSIELYTRFFTYLFRFYRSKYIYYLMTMIQLWWSI